jgi:hypothetical protein
MASVLPGPELPREVTLPLDLPVREAPGLESEASGRSQDEVRSIPQRLEPYTRRSLAPASVSARFSPLP